MQSFKEHLNESSLSRIYSKTQEYDTGAITAYRGDKYKDKNGNEHPVFSRQQNQKRNKMLLSTLLQKGYSVTKVMGSYIENYKTEKAEEVGEESFFVADHEKRGDLRKTLVSLGERFDQDSILYVPQGGQGRLIGTSNRDEAFPPKGQEEIVGKPSFGHTDGKFFSRVKGRQFAFESVNFVKDIPAPNTINGKRGMEIMAEKIESYDKKRIDEETLKE